MDGERDLARLLETLDVERRDGVYTFVTGEWPDLEREAHAVILEREGHTYVVDVDAAHRVGANVSFESAWLTVTAHSSLDAVGLTARLSGALAEAMIACNVIAGAYHDHLLVPVSRATEAIAVLRGLSSR